MLPVLADDGKVTGSRAQPHQGEPRVHSGTWTPCDDTDPSSPWSSSSSFSLLSLLSLLLLLLLLARALLCSAVRCGLSVRVAVVRAAAAAAADTQQAHARIEVPGLSNRIRRVSFRGHASPTACANGLDCRTCRLTRVLPSRRGPHSRSTQNSGHNGDTGHPRAGSHGTTGTAARAASEARCC
jgi:hypothetical protein